MGLSQTVLKIQKPDITSTSIRLWSANINAVTISNHQAGCQAIALMTQRHFLLTELLNAYTQGERNFDGVQLQGISLFDLDLREISLQHANLSHAYLPYCNFSYAHLRKINLCQAELGDVKFCKADLRGAKLLKARLHRSDLRGANLQAADLRGAMLAYADLSRVDLREADLRGADLSRAKLTKANLAGARFEDANLFQVAGVEDWSIVRVNQRTTLPTGYRANFPELIGGLNQSGSDVPDSPDLSNI